MGDDSWGESGVINYGNGVSVIVVYGDELRDVHNYRVNLTYNYHSPEHTNRMADRRSGLETSFCVYLDSQGINFDGSLEDGYTALCAERNKTIEKIRAFDCEFSSSLFAIESAPQLFIAV